MSYIKRKRSFHPFVAVLYVLSYLSMIAYIFYSLNYNTQLQFNFILSPIFPEGINIPVFVSLIALAGAMFASGYFMHEVLVKRLEMNRKLNLHFFVIPLLLLSSPNLIETTQNALFIAVSAMTLSYVLSMAVLQSDIKKVFISGFIAGILFLFSGATASLLLLFPLLLFANRFFSVRAVLVYGFSFILPALYYLTYLYLIDFSDWSLFLKENDLGFMAYEQLLAHVNLYVLVVLSLVLLIVISRVHIKLSEYKIAIRRAYSSTLFYILLFVLSIAFMPSIYSLTYLSSLMFISLFYYMRMVTDVKKKALLAVLYMVPLIIFATNILFTHYLSI